MDSPPEADPVAPASTFTAAASETSRLRGEDPLPTRSWVSRAKPGTILMTDPKPTAQEVFMMAVREPLAPLLTAGRMLRRWGKFSRQQVRMASSRATTIPHWRRFRTTKTTTGGMTPVIQCQEGRGAPSRETSSNWGSSTKRRPSRRAFRARLSR